VTSQEEQKYKMTLMAVYSLDLVDQFIQMLAKICSYHEQPLLHLVSLPPAQDSRQIWFVNKKINKNIF
jgi:hypothetical protein